MRSAIRILLVLMMFLTNSSAVSAQAEHCDLGDLPAKFSIPPAATYHIVVIDTSGSMKPIFGGVRGAVESYVTAVADLKTRHHLLLIKFATTPVVLFDRAVQNGGAEAVALIPSDPDTGLAGRHTNIGLAMEKVIEHLRSPKERSLLFVLFLTDGRHDPAPGAPYPRRWGSDWERLRFEAAALSNRHLIHVYGVGLGGKTDIQLVQGVFKQAGIISVNPNAIRGTVERIRREVITERLKLAIEKELRSGALTLAPAEETTWGKLRPPGEVEQSFRVRSSYQRLAAAVQIDTLRFSPEERAQVRDATAFSVSHKPERLSFTVPPGGESAAFRVRLQVPPSAIHVGPGKSTEVAGRLVFGSDAQLEHASILKCLGFNPQGRLEPKEVRLRFTAEVPLPRWPFVALALLLAYLLLPPRRAVPLYRHAFTVRNSSTRRKEGAFSLDPSGLMPKQVRLGGPESEWTVGGVSGVLCTLGAEPGKREVWVQAGPGKYLRMGGSTQHRGTIMAQAATPAFVIGDLEVFYEEVRPISSHRYSRFRPTPLKIVALVLALAAVALGYMEVKEYL